MCAAMMVRYKTTTTKGLRGGRGRGHQPPRPRSARPRADASSLRLPLGRGASSTSKVSSGRASGRIQYRVLLPRIESVSRDMGSPPRTVILTALRCVFIWTSTPACQHATTHTCDRSMHDRAVLELNGHALVIQFHQKSTWSAFAHAPHELHCRGWPTTTSARSTPSLVPIT